MPGQPGPPLETLATGGAAVRGGALLVDLLVVAEEAGQPKGFSTGVADVLLPLGVNPHVVAQRHVVGVGLVAEVAPEVARLVGVLVVEQGAGVLVGAAAQVAGVGPLVRVQVHRAPLQADVGGAVGGGRRRQMLGGAVVGRQLVGGGKAFTAAIALKVHGGPGALRALAQAGGGVGGELPLGAETFATFLAVVLFLGKVEAQVVLHGQPVGVRRVANVTVVLPNFVKVLVIGQAAGVTVRFPTFFTGKRAASTFSWVKFLRSGGAGGGVGLLEALVEVLHAHDLALGGLPPHGLQLGGARLLKAGRARATANEAFGPLLLVKTEVVNELLLDLEGLPTFFTLVPKTGTETKHRLHREKPPPSPIRRVLQRGPGGTSSGQSESVGGF